MQVTERPGILPPTRKINTAVLIRDWADQGNNQKKEPSDLFLIEEYLLRVMINDCPAMQIACTPTCLPELVLGRLLTEGYISSCGDVAGIDVCRGGGIAKVSLNPGRFTTLPASESEDFPETVTTCCTDTRAFSGSLRQRMPLSEVKKISWEPEWVWALDDRFGEDTELHRSTHATHACFLSLHGEIIFETEDIGRHNAIDKAVGWAVVNDVPLEDCMIYTTGRMPVDMVRKVIRAGIPVMVSKEAPTMEGLRLAKKYGLTLIGNVKHGKMHIFV